MLGQHHKDYFHRRENTSSYGSTVLTIQCLVSSRPRWNNFHRSEQENWYSTLNFDLSISQVIATGSGGSSIYQVIPLVDENITFSFEKGDVFGIHPSDSNQSKVAVLHQIGGGFSYQVELKSGNFHSSMFTTSTLTETNIYPLIAIETGKSSVSAWIYHIWEECMQWW